jgi:CelD/BcsL family acetyltransferase involved in cellulose biosynthesis
MPNNKMTLHPELERPALRVFDAPALAPAIGELAPATGRGTSHELVDLADVPMRAWSHLSACAIEPNAFYDPAWARPVSAHARGRMHAEALLAWDGPDHERLIGMLPVVSAWRALKLPIPVLVAWQAYAPLTTPLLDRDVAEQAVAGLLDAARKAGASAILFPNLAQDGPAAAAITGALSRRGTRPHVHDVYERARLDAHGDAAILLRDALGPKKLKELRRQRNRLADFGPVEFAIARSPEAITPALETFLSLESQGWKGARGTALAQHEGDRRFIRDAAMALAATPKSAIADLGAFESPITGKPEIGGRLEIATLSHGGIPVASGLVLRHLRRAYFFKIAIDEAQARTSPGVQLTLDLTRHFCESTEIDDVDSTADADHPMIDHVWRGRQPLCHLFAPTQPNNFVTDILSGVIAGRAFARSHGSRLIRGCRHLREKRS